MSASAPNPASDIEHAPCFELRDVVRARDPHFELTIPSLAFEVGAVHAVVGPNGSGKTTLLHMLDLLDEPTRGTILYRGRAVSPSMPDAADVRRRFALVMQDPFLFRGTVQDDLAYALRLRGAPREEIDRRVEEALAKVGLKGLERRRTSDLSGGEAKRVAIARAFVLEPDVLLMDEPTANVDRGQVHRVEDQILSAHAECGTTVIVTTHDLSQARRLTSSIVSIVGGRIASVPPDNVFHCEVARDADGTRAKLPGGLSVHIASTPEGPAHIAIHPSDIIVSLEPIDSSARNCFPARVARVTLDDGGVWLDVDAGAPFQVLITKESYDKLGLHPGAQAFLTFKASSVHVL